MSMSRYFGGSLDLFSLDGWGESSCMSHIHYINSAAIGTDALLKLRCLDEAGDVEI